MSYSTRRRATRRVHALLCTLPLVSGGPHKASFWADGLPTGTAALVGASRQFGNTPAPHSDSPPRRVTPADSAAGAYLAVVAGCNGCHTSSWDATDGRTPPAEQMTGSALGYRGPWGTTYAANLRLLAGGASEDGWVRLLRTARGGTGRPAPSPRRRTSCWCPARPRARSKSAA